MRKVKFVVLNLLVTPERATTEDGVNEDKRCDGPNAETFSEKCDRLDWDVTDCVEYIEDARDRLLVRRLRSTAIIKHKRVSDEADHSNRAEDIFDNPYIEGGLDDDKGGSTSPVVALNDVELVPQLRQTNLDTADTGNDGNFDGTQDPWELDDTFDGDAFGGGTSRGTASY
ncbi:hypothetical protein CHU98_g9261 [Xylaria longipes]|nr:hypothetical protein CHU98_g9261 [Xylaria longipes]